jgi:hypothetical protein
MRRPAGLVHGAHVPPVCPGVSPDDRLKPDAAPATGFSLPSRPERVA